MKEMTLMFHETHGVEELAEFINKINNDKNLELTKVTAYPTGVAHIDYWETREI